MLDKILKIFKKEYQTLNKIEVSKSRLIQNYKHLKSQSKGIKIAPVVKSNGYGHGMITVSQILDPLGAPFFCVDSLYEAYQLLNAKIKTPILIMGYTDPQNFKVKKLPFSYAVFDLEMVSVLDKYQPGSGIHIFVDTGMHREGIQIEDLPNFLKKLKQFKNLKIEGLMSHLATAEKPNDPLTRKQLNNFQYVQQIVKEVRIYPKWVHVSNSAGLLNDLNPGCNMTRVGLAIYGLSTSDLSSALKPVLRLTSRIIQIKKLQKGDKVGYDGTFLVKKSMILGVLGAGYYDGVDRRLSNKGIVLVDGVECPIIGRVSMNITTIDLSRVSNPYIGQEVLIYSDNPADKNSIENAAKICKTISYDILIGLAASTKRGVL